MSDSLFTFQALTTLGGAAMLTFMIVQKTKNKWILKNFPSDIYAVIIGSIVLFLSQVGMNANPLDWKVYFLSIANGFLVAYAAGKSNDDASKPKV